MGKNSSLVFGEDFPIVSLRGHHRLRPTSVRGILQERSNWLLAKIEERKQRLGKDVPGYQYEELKAVNQALEAFNLVQAMKASKELP